MIAIQDQVPHHHCYGCGADNDKGLQIKSYWPGALFGLRHVAANALIVVPVTLDL